MESPLTIDALLQQERLPEQFRSTIERVLQPLATKIASHANVAKRCLVLGLCGAQGSGKSTLALALKTLLAAANIRTAVLSIDDFYLTGLQRQALGARLHPLLATRGVPGTHDVELAIQTIDALRSAAITAIPKFDKAQDDRAATHEWPQIQGPMQVILLEGWCVGAVPEMDVALATTVNSLERTFDAELTWRRYVNDCLRDAYQKLFGKLERLILLQAPSFEVVYRWRLEQEHKLRARLLEQGRATSKVMDDAQVQHFIAHYERLTRHILTEMPARADIVVQLDTNRAPMNVLDRWH